MTTPRTSGPAPDGTLSTIFGRLFENEFATLDGIAISQRVTAGHALHRRERGAAVLAGERRASGGIRSR